MPALALKRRLQLRNKRKKRRSYGKSFKIKFKKIKHALYKFKKIARRKRKKRRIKRKLRRRLRLVKIMPPTGHMFTQEWLNTPKAKQLIPTPSYMEFHGGETAALTDAKSTHRTKLFHGISETSSSSYAAVVPRARVWGERGSVITPDNILLTDQSSNFDVRSIHLHPAFHFWNPFRLVRIPGTAAAVTFCDSHNYYHWMYDVLVRFQLLSLSGVPIDKYIVNPLNRQFQIETLSLLGIPRDRMIETHRQFHMQADRLVLTSALFLQHYPKWTGDYLREQLMLKHGFHNHDTGHKRLFIRRGNVTNRRALHNEAEIESRLASQGFYCTSLDSMSVIQQIQLFHSADVIVAPHGAALTNLTFCRPGATVIELFNPQYIPNHYWKISNYQGLNYYYVKGAGIRPPGLEGAWIGGQDFTIEWRLIEKTLKLAGL